MSSPRQILILCLALGAALTGCASQTEEQLLKASDALSDCDMRTAHEHFELAYESDASHPDAALGFAITDTIFLLEDPEITAGLADIGFSAPLNSETILWGQDALLARLRRGESCDSVSSFAESAIPYGPLRDTGIDGLDILAEGLTVDALIARLRAIDGRIVRLSQAYETAASAMGDREVTIDGGCGFGRIVVQAPELYGAAALFELLHTAIMIAPTYDWSFLLRDLFESDPEQNIRALQTLFTVVNAGAAVNGQQPLLRALSLFDRGLEASGQISTPVADALFDWSQMDATVVADLRLMTERARGSLHARAPRDIPYMSPTVQVHVSAFLFSPPNQATLSAPMWSVASDLDYSWVQSNGESVQEFFQPYFSPVLFDDAVSIEWSLGDRWNEVDLSPVFDPAGRYGDMYQCANP